MGQAVHGRTGGNTLRIFNAHQNETVATIAELIIPATDTPGARAALVNQFIDLIVAEWYTEEERSRFLNGLAGIDARSRSSFGPDFTNLTATQQVALLSGLDAEVAALREASAEPEKHFFQQMKWLTVYGYYTSDIGVNQELKYQMIPGRYDPCVETGIPSPREMGWPSNATMPS